MFPLYIKSAPVFKAPAITLALIIVNIVIFLFSVLSGSFELIISEYGIIPEKILQGSGWFSLITAMFLHADIIHLLGNMWFLWLFGKAVEDNLGKVRFIVFYLAAGIIAGLAHIFLSPPSHQVIPAIGASGAISAILGAHLIISPKSKVRSFFMIIYRPVFFFISAYFYIPIWFLYQLLYIGTETSVAFAAHIGGFIAGMILALILKKKILYVDYFVDKNQQLYQARSWDQASDF